MSRLLAPLGITLILCGVGCLLFTGTLVYAFFNEPSQFKLLQYLTEHLKLSDQVISGTIDGKEFTMAIPDSVFGIAYLGLSIMALGLIIGLLQALIGNGISLLKAAHKSEARTEPREAAPRRSRDI